ncbi:hypothetical protein E3N88_21944 [Mikania micrantha]|uniref:Uncharacterized protein n=1 Tax=Mikania micrantha TaxID=192012 RepID=A0A5N6NAI4_9ASTR|nr:hypothetical protein E3N88_21944 [Mikania micrantha]
MTKPSLPSGVSSRAFPVVAFPAVVESPVMRFRLRAQPQSPKGRRPSPRSQSSNHRMSLVNLRTSSDYQEAVTATEEIESPTLGFIRPSDFKTGSITLSTAIIKQNNTLIYLVTKQAERLSELGGEVERLKRAVEVLGKREVKPVDLEDSIESLTKRLDNLAISGKPSASNKKGQIYVFKDPHKIFKEEYEKQKKK